MDKPFHAKLLRGYTTVIIPAYAPGSHMRQSWAPGLTPSASKQWKLDVQVES